MDASPIFGSTGYVQEARKSQWGRIQSKSPRKEEPQWARDSAASKSQNLANQIPPTSLEPQFSPRSVFKSKLVHEWTVSDVSSWLRTILTPQFSLSEAGSPPNDSNHDSDTMTDYIESFSEGQVDGQYLITKIRSEQDLVHTLDMDDSDDHMETIALLFSAIQSLKQEAKQQFHALHPMKQSSANIAIREEFGVISVPSTPIAGPRTANMEIPTADDDVPSKCFLFTDTLDE